MGSPYQEYTPLSVYKEPRTKGVGITRETISLLMQAMLFAEIIVIPKKEVSDLGLDSAAAICELSALPKRMRSYDIPDTDK